MAGEASAQREKQDQSIKARKKELFVEEEDLLQTGPRKTMRDYLKDTPAAPLSKNVKLSLWGSAVPVVLLFVAALLTGGSRSTAKAPDEMIIPQHAKPAAPSLTTRSDDKPSAPGSDAKSKDRKDDVAANSDKPADEKPKKPKKPAKKNSKPKETVVVQNTEGDKPNSDDSKDKADDSDKDQARDSKASDSGKKPNTASSGSKNKTGAGKDGSTKPATPEKPRKQAPPLFKKPKPKVYSYPKRDGEKKVDPATDDGIP